MQDLLGTQSVMATNITKQINHRQPCAVSASCWARVRVCVAYLRLEDEEVDLWNLFWIANFVIAGSSFVIITGIVIYRGFSELRALFTSLAEHSGN